MPKKLNELTDETPEVVESIRVYPVWTFVRETPVVDEDGKPKTGSQAALEVVEHSDEVYPTMQAALDAAKKAAPEGVGVHVDYSNAGVS